MRDIAILAYHSIDTSGSVVSISPQRFAEQMAAVSETGCRGITLREAIAARNDRGGWPEETVVITFDDGFASLHDHALPVLTRLGFAATVFLVTDFIAGANEWEVPRRGLGRRPILDWRQIADLQRAGWEIGSHTRTHPNLRSLSDEVLEDEIAGARETLEQRLGESVPSFAYPYGLFDDRAERIVAREHKAGVTTLLRRASRDETSRLPRIDAYYLHNPGQLRRLILGQLDGYLTLRRWGRRARRAVMG